MKKFSLCVFEKFCVQMLSKRSPFTGNPLKQLTIMCYGCQASRCRCHFVKKLYAPEHINIMHDVAVFTNLHK